MELFDINSYSDMMRYLLENNAPLANRPKVKFPSQKSFPINTGGVHKAFDPKSHLVYAKDDDGMEDFIKESNMAKHFAKHKMAQEEQKEQLDYNRIISFQRPVEDEERLELMLFDRDRRISSAYHDEDDDEIFFNRTRRVSIYGEGPRKGLTLTTFLNDYYLQQHELLEEEKNDFSFEVDGRKQLECIVYQLMIIHCVLHEHNVRHGDLHMGNIKIIMDGEVPLVKAFDFGWSKIHKKGIHVADLKYLFKKRVAKDGATRFFEQHFIRNRRSADHPKMVKHYPLHKINAVYGICDEKHFENQMKEIGDQLIKRLKNRRRHSCYELFEEASDRIVQTLQGHY